jgi:hypothetical protein
MNAKKKTKSKGKKMVIEDEELDYLEFGLEKPR